MNGSVKRDAVTSKSIPVPLGVSLPARSSGPRSEMTPIEPVGPTRISASSAGSGSGPVSFSCFALRRAVEKFRLLSVAGSRLWSASKDSASALWGSPSGFGGSLP
jgi:hypothetical protein